MSAAMAELLERYLPDSAFAHLTMLLAALIGVVSMMLLSDSQSRPRRPRVSVKRSQDRGEIMENYAKAFSINMLGVVVFLAIAAMVIAFTWWVISWAFGWR
ncbi:MAG: hypothetical protein OXJ37_04770 [Bryobacterales bacterium]|nr:hypothetical protein [Bryobacterales bacterium]